MFEGNVRVRSNLTRMLENGAPGMLGGQTGGLVNTIANNGVNNRDSLLEGQKSGIFGLVINSCLDLSASVASSVSPDGCSLGCVEGSFEDT